MSFGDSRAYWLRYLGFSSIGLPVAWVMERGVPAWAPLAFQHHVMAQLGGPAPTTLLLLDACAGRFADAGSTAIALRASNLYESAPGLGPSPDYAALYRLALGQSLSLVALTVILPTQFAIAGRLLLLGVWFVSACATFQNLVLYTGHFVLPIPKLDRHTSSGLSEETAVLLHNTDVVVYNLLAIALQVFAFVVSSSIAVALLFYTLAVSEFQGVLRPLTLVGTWYFAMIGAMAGKATRQDRTERLLDEEAAVIIAKLNVQRQPTFSAWAERDDEIRQVLKSLSKRPDLEQAVQRQLNRRNAGKKPVRARR